MKIFFFVVFVLLQCSRALASPSDLRLPRHLEPESYDVDLRPYLIENPESDKRFTYDGAVHVRLVAVAEDDSIVLHAKKLVVSKVSVDEISEDNSTKTLPIVTWSLDEEREFLVVKMASNLTQGKKIDLRVEFTGKLNDDMTGFYRSRYQLEGQEVFMATTQFEPAGARRAFPCMDEPDRKAVFRITIRCEDPYQALSNMDVVEGFPKTVSGLRVYTFGDSLKMSTYLVAFVVHRFYPTSLDSGQGRPKIQVWSKYPQSMGYMNYACGVAAKALKFYENLYGIQFPLPKIDLAAIPDFAAGAMENFGLITFRETALLYSPEETDNATKVWVTSVISHELAHQWFGNLVTMKWWNDLWLNEAFAEFMEHLALSHVLKGLPFSPSFVEAEMQRSFDIDALNSTRAISQEVTSPDQIDALFDLVTYQKGSSVLRMLWSFLGNKTFFEGITNYLTKYKFENAEGADLWKSLGDEATTEGKTLQVDKIMNSWLSQPGFPVVEVKIDDGSVNCKQKRFFLNYELESSATWDIPLTFSYRSRPDWRSSKSKIFWLSTENRTLSFQLPGLNGSDWLVVNVGQAGVYRVNYEESNWRRIMGQLMDDHNLIHVTNRAQIINDALSLARSGQMSYYTALDLLKYLWNEDSYYPWKAATDGLRYILVMLRGHAGYAPFLKMIRSLGSERFRFVANHSVDRWNEAFLQPLMYGLLCRARDAHCLITVKKMAKSWMNSGKNIPPNLRRVVLCEAMRAGVDGLFDAILEKYKTEKNEIIREDFRSAMPCTKEKLRLEWLMKESFANGVIRKQDAREVSSDVASNPFGQSLAWDHISSNWDVVVKFIESKSALGKIVGGVVRWVADARVLEDLKRRVESLKLEGTSRLAFVQAIERVENNIRWKKDYLPSVVEWLDRQA